MMASTSPGRALPLTPCRMVGGGGLPPAVDRRHPHVLPRYEHAAAVATADVLPPAVVLGMTISNNAIKPNMNSTADTSPGRFSVHGRWRRRRRLPRRSGTPT